MPGRHTADQSPEETLVACDGTSDSMESACPAGEERR